MADDVIEEPSPSFRDPELDLTVSEEGHGLVRDPRIGREADRGERVTFPQRANGGAAVLSADSAAIPRPLLRGVLHQVAFSVSLVVGTLLIVGADGVARHAAAAVFAGSVAACFGVSALYHRVNWTVRMRLWMRRLDHAGVYLLIVGSYTPVCLLVLSGAWRLGVLIVVSVGACAGIAEKFVWAAAPKWVAALLGIALGWTAVVILPQLATRLNPAAVVLLGLGGLAYTAGAIIYARHRPDPLPTVFGYHELFHALTIIAASCQYVAIAFFVIRAG